MHSSISGMFLIWQLDRPAVLTADENGVLKVPGERLYVRVIT